MTKKIAILGASGSVGSQALDVARARGYEIDLISANRSVDLMESAIREFSPRVAVMTDEASAIDLKARVKDTPTKVLSGKDALLSAISESDAQVVVNAILGEAGLMPTLATIDSGKRLALSNKESLVIAGDIVMERARSKGVEIIPVDSEHSAIFQCLKAGESREVSRLLLTASGGPFYGKSREELSRVTLADALAHPTWKMGKKITVDSATLMNKGFEIIEAHHLFGVSPEKIDVLIHRESILHSAVEYIDRAVIGQLSLPDMRQCVQYAVDYPARMESALAPLDLTQVGALTFAKPDCEAFPLLSLARRSISDGGAMPAVINAADEVAVAAHLSGEISFLEISEVVIRTYEEMLHAKDLSTLEEIISADREARQITEKIIKAKHRA
ncbi:MAG: 1-deoxy-D-xylulose-5-phosphate reductoisomerase [Clostridia bacterium]|nr:1-deoxy-D-xylulose-5-phosphate reductoisomerase [Clostridia bacterium]